MVFSSLVFICVFLPVAFLLHLAIPSIKGKNALLIVASLVFYAYGEPVYILLMIASTLVNWILGLLVGAAPGLEGGKGESESESGKPSASARRKAWTAVAVAANLALLCVFKYADMLIASLNALSGASIPLPGISLPIGISFYTFQALSYVIDVYRGEVNPQRSYWTVLLYIAFFPQLIAGPIIKYHDVEKQLRDRRASLSDVAAGFRRFCIGLGKKVLIANTVAIAVDSIFSAPLESVNVLVAWLAAIAYLVQIYFDFSGYSDMAIGMARMFGFRYKENFQYPYRSASVTEFWRRWHISLSTWFKEYLYIPLGGNRRGRGRTVLNKLAVFALCGLWHGAAWTFVAWGLIHGLFLLLEVYVPALRKLPRPIGWLYCMVVVTTAFVLFRADDFAQGGWMVAQMFTGFHFEYACMALAARQLTPLFVIALLAGLIGALPIKEALESRLERASARTVIAAEAASYAFALALLGACLLGLSGGGYNPFIYFRF